MVLGVFFPPLLMACLVLKKSDVSRTDVAALISVGNYARPGPFSKCSLDRKTFFALIEPQRESLFPVVKLKVSASTGDTV